MAKCRINFVIVCRLSGWNAHSDGTICGCHFIWSYAGNSSTKKTHLDLGARNGWAYPIAKPRLYFGFFFLTTKLCPNRTGWCSQIAEKLLTFFFWFGFSVYLFFAWFSARRFARSALGKSEVNNWHLFAKVVIMQLDFLLVECSRSSLHQISNDLQNEDAVHANQAKSMRLLAPDTLMRLWCSECILRYTLCLSRRQLQQIQFIIQLNPLAVATRKKIIKDTYWLVCALHHVGLTWRSSIGNEWTWWKQKLAIARRRDDDDLSHAVWCVHRHYGHSHAIIVLWPFFTSQSVLGGYLNRAAQGKRMHQRPSTMCSVPYWPKSMSSPQKQRFRWQIARAYTSTRAY